MHRRRCLSQAWNKGAASIFEEPLSRPLSSAGLAPLRSVAGIRWRVAFDAAGSPMRMGSYKRTMRALGALLS